MQVTMQHAERLTLSEMQSFSAPATLSTSPAPAREQIYGPLEGVLCTQKYLGPPKKTQESCASIWSRSADSEWRKPEPRGRSGSPGCRAATRKITSPALRTVSQPVG